MRKEDDKEREVQMEDKDQERVAMEELQKFLGAAPTKKEVEKEKVNKLPIPMPVQLVHLILFLRTVTTSNY